MKKILVLFFVLLLTGSSLSSCGWSLTAFDRNDPFLETVPNHKLLHEHTYHWETTENLHQKICDCTCEFADSFDPMPHVDGDENRICDDCEYVWGDEPTQEQKPTYLGSFEEWIDAVTCEEIACITWAEETQGIAAGYFQSVRRMREKEDISLFLEQLRTCTMKLSQAHRNGAEGGTLITVELLFQNGSMKKLTIEDQCYVSRNGDRFRLDQMLNFEDYANGEAEHCFRVITHGIAVGTVFCCENCGEATELGEITGIEELEFIGFWDDSICEAVPRSYTHSVRLPFGTLYIYNESVFG